MPHGPHSIRSAPYHAPIIAISMGDYNGIGPEVLLKSLSKTDLSASVPLVIGHHSVLEYYAEISGLELPFRKIRTIQEAKQGYIHIYNISEEASIPVRPGVISKKAGDLSMKAVDKGIQFCLEGKCHALVTSPISKEAIHKAGYNVPGHTEFLAERTSSGDTMMVLASGDLRVGLLTIHIPLKKVAASVTKPNILRHLDIFQKSLIRDFGIPSPSIAVLGLNPHAGDGGVIGNEELSVVAPAIQKAGENNITAKGPFAADGFFGNRLYKKFDGILAMYHDQGLVPFKTLTFGTGVNVTAGLPIIRTSPDHGTAFDIAGRNRADERSFKAAYNLAVRMAVNSSS